MMPIERAIIVALAMCEDYNKEINKWEKLTQRCDTKHRTMVGALRALMHHAGIPKHELPETPFVDPEHIANLDRYKAEKRKLKPNSGVDQIE